MFLLPQQIDRIMETSFTPEGVIRLNQLEEKDFGEIPLLRQVQCLCHHIRCANGLLKLTPNGNLPLKVVREIYEEGIRDYYYEKYPTRRIREEEARFVQIARELAVTAGMIRKQHNALSLTRKGEKLLSDAQLLLETLIHDFVHHFPLNNFDRHDTIAGAGFRDAGLSLLLFDKVRKERQGETPTGWDYAGAYFDTRPEVFEDRWSMQAYLFRFFENFMELFGLVTTKRHLDREKGELVLSIIPTPLADRMVCIDEDVERLSVKKIDALRIYRVRVLLKEVTPPVWRRLQLPSSLSLNDFHHLLQQAMGWTNSHLHEFEKEGVCYTDWVDGEQPAVQYDGMSVADLMKEKGDRMTYRYDFGDDWMHTLELEESLLPDEGVDYPFFLEGERRCPPEDCGGPHGYYRMLKILNDPRDPEREEYLVWLGGPFDPESYQPPKRSRFRVLADR